MIGYSVLANRHGMLCINFTEFCQHYPVIISKKTGGSTHLVPVSKRYDIFTKSHNRDETCKNHCQKNVFMKIQLREHHRRIQDQDFPKCLSRREESRLSLTTAPCRISCITSKADVTSAPNLGVDSTQVENLWKEVIAQHDYR